MRLLYSELHKAWGQRVFALCLAVLVAANLFLLYIGTKPKEGSASTTAYHAISNDLSGLNLAEQQDLIQGQIDLVYGVLQIEQMLTDSAGNPEWIAQARQEHADVFDKYEDAYRNKEYKLYTDNLNTEYVLLSQIKAELDTVAAYPEFLNEVQEKANRLSGLSIFQSSGSSYNQKNIEKTAKVYAGMNSVQINYVPQKGIYTALDYQFTDLILFAAILLIASLFVRQERDSGILNVIRTTPGGRLNTAVAKLVALAFSILAVILLMYGVNLIYCDITFGLGSLSRSIQSIPALMRCTMRVTVAEYLGIFLLAKWAGAFVMGLWVMLAMLWTQRTFSGWLLSIALPLMQWVVRTTIPATSHLNVIKYANLSSLMRTNELLGNYRNLYWFDTPVGLPLVEWLTAVIYGILLFGGFCLLFCFGQLQSTPAFTGLVRKRARTKPTTILRQESYKMFVLGGTAMVLLLFSGYQIWNVQSTENYINAEGIYYAYYMKQLEGPYTQETYDKLQAMQSEFEPIFALRQELQRGEITKNTYQLQMQAYYGLQEKLNVLQQITDEKLSYIKENPKAHLLYEPGWEDLFGFSGDDDLQDVLWAGLLSCLCFANLFAFEKKGGMQRVIKATPLGRRHTVRSKLIIGSVGAVGISLLTYVPHMVVAFRDYGLGEFFAPAMSIPAFHDVPPWIPLFFILLYGVVTRLLACFTMMLIMLWLSDRMTSTLSAMFVGTISFCLLPLLALSGLYFLRWMGFYPLFHAVEMLKRPVGVFATVLCMVLAASLCYLCTSNLYDRWEG